MKNGEAPLPTQCKDRFYNGPSKQAKIRLVGRVLGPSILPRRWLSHPLPKAQGPQEPRRKLYNAVTNVSYVDSLFGNEDENITGAFENPEVIKKLNSHCPTDPHLGATGSGDVTNCIGGGFSPY